MSLSPLPLASIVITSYNYEQFLTEAIDSALAQTYANVEVIVVDDGSSDRSPEIIASYGSRVVPVLKTNGGQASAFNAAFRASRGEVIVFLDADDTLLPSALAQAVPLCLDPGVSKVHWPMAIVDGRGRRTGTQFPEEPLPDGDLLEGVLKRGEPGYVWPMTSANAWRRAFLERVLPMPERPYRADAESYLATLAPAFGPIRALSEPLSTYRVHADSLSYRKTITEGIEVSAHQHAALGEAFGRFGLAPDIERWVDAAAMREVLLACDEMANVIPPGSLFLFVEWNQWGPGQILKGRHAVPFLERDGQYWGRPANSNQAIEELERQRHAGASHIVFAKPALWWLRHYSGLRQHLGTRYSCVLENSRLQVFKLSPRS